jgi:hypothetical protein
MKPTEALERLGQSLWLANITRSLLDSGAVARYVDQYAVTRLTSNPSIFAKAIASGDCDAAIRRLAGQGITGEQLFFEPAHEDIRRAADLFLGMHERTDRLDGWVSLEVVAIETCIAAGIALNVTLLFSAAHYRAAANAYQRGIERRIASGLDPAVGSVASMFISPWDVAVPGPTLEAFLDHGEVDDPLPTDGDVEQQLARFARAGVDLDALAAKLQADGAAPSSPTGTTCSSGSIPRAPHVPDERLQPTRNRRPVVTETSLRTSAVWKALEAHHATMAGRHLRELFAEDPGRGEWLCAEAAGIYLDCAEDRVTDETMRLLVRLAFERQVPERRDAMLAGEPINAAKGRSVLHVALRMPRSTHLTVDGVDVLAEVHKVKMSRFANQVHSGTWRGHSGKAIRNVINIERLASRDKEQVALSSMRSELGGHADKKA